VPTSEEMNEQREEGTMRRESKKILASQLRDLE